MDMLKSYTSNPSENSAKIVSFQQYLSDVIIQLQHWYPHKNFSQENFKVIKKLPDKSVVNYLKCWTSNSLSSSNLGLFLCPYEREVAVWLLNEQDSRGIEKIINMNLEIFKLYRLFKMIIAHLIVKITHDNLTESNCMKFLNGLSFFLKSTTLFEYDGDNCLLSYELKNHDIYYKKCIDCIFSDNSLFKLFNIFVNKKNTVYYCSMIVVRALMENEIIKKIVGKKLLVEDWKVKFLNQLKKKFQKNQSIEDAENFNVVLNFFEYQHDEAVDMVILLTNVSGELQMIILKLKK